MFNNKDGGWGAKRNHTLPEIKPRKKEYPGIQSSEFNKQKKDIPEYFKKVKGQKP